MSTIILWVVVLGAIAGIIYGLMKTGKVKDVNNNNIPDVIEEKVENIKAKVKKAKAIVEKVENAVAKVKKPATKKVTKK